MNRRSCTSLLVAGIVAMAGVAAAEKPTAEAIVERAISAVELESTLEEHNMILLSIRQEETATDGTTNESDMTALIHGANLESTRLEISGDIALALNNKSSWAMIQGKVDERPQTPRMAAGTIRQTLFPLLLPYSMRMDGVRHGVVTETTLDGIPVWVVDIQFDPEFFAAPSMVTNWSVFINREDSTVMGASFLPADQFRAVRAEGIRYRYLKRQTVDGLVLPAQVLLEGIDLNGVENGHVRVTKISAKTVEPLDLSLFIHPDEAARIDAGEVL